MVALAQLAGGKRLCHWSSILTVSAGSSACSLLAPAQHDIAGSAWAVKATMAAASGIVESPREAWLVCCLHAAHSCYNAEGEFIGGGAQGAGLDNAFPMRRLQTSVCQQSSLNLTASPCAPQSDRVLALQEASVSLSTQKASCCLCECSKCMSALHASSLSDLSCAQCCSSRHAGRCKAAFLGGGASNVPGMSCTAASALLQLASMQHKRCMSDPCSCHFLPADAGPGDVCSANVLFFCQLIASQGRSSTGPCQIQSCSMFAADRASTFGVCLPNAVPHLETYSTMK